MTIYIILCVHAKYLEPGEQCYCRLYSPYDHLQSIYSSFTNLFEDAKPVLEGGWLKVVAVISQFTICEWESLGKLLGQLRTVTAVSTENRWAILIEKQNCQRLQLDTELPDGARPAPAMHCTICQARSCFSVRKNIQKRPDVQKMSHTRRGLHVLKTS